MVSMPINCLRRRFGISEAQARLYADLFFGGARDV